MLLKELRHSANRRQVQNEQRLEAVAAALVLKAHLLEEEEDKDFFGWLVRNPVKLRAERGFLLLYISLK